MSGGGTKDGLVERLRACENDPMWADHAEIPKLWCKQAADRIEQLERGHGALLDAAEHDQARIKQLEGLLERALDRWKTDVSDFYDSSDFESFTTVLAARAALKGEKHE